MDSRQGIVHPGRAGSCHRPAVLAAIGKSSCNADGSHGVQAVRILPDFPFRSVGRFSFVLLKRHRIDHAADPVDRLLRHLMRLQKCPRVRIILCIEQFMVVRIMFISFSFPTLPVVVLIGVILPY